MATRQRELFSYDKDRAVTAANYTDEILGYLREHFGVSLGEIVRFEDLEGEHSSRSALLDRHGMIAGHAVLGCRRMDYYGVDLLICNGMGYSIGNRVAKGTGPKRRFTIREESGSPQYSEGERLRRFYETRRGTVPDFYSFAKHAPGAPRLSYWCLLDTREFLDLWLGGELATGTFSNPDGTSGRYFEHSDLRPAIVSERGEF